MPAKNPTKEKDAKDHEAALEKINDSVATDQEMAPLSGNIDDRMAALLKDHQKMGARPK